MKRELLSLLLTILPICLWADAVEINGIYYNLISKSRIAEVTKNPNYYSGNIIIPESIKYEDVEYSITSIGEKAFYACNNLYSVSIGNNVLTIGNSAFEKCENLNSVKIGDKVISIGERSFLKCKKISSLLFPDSLTSIGNSAFCDCITLNKIEIPNNVLSIGWYAFQGCKGLTSITMGNSVTTIGGSAFNECTNLQKVIVKDIAAWCGVTFEDNVHGTNPLSYANHIYSDENTEIIDLTIPENVTYIGEIVFVDCSGLSSVTFPNSVTTIGKRSFGGCTGLTSITIPNSVTSIGENAFSTKNVLSINVDSSNKFYDSRDGCNAIIETNANKLILGCMNTIIPDGITTIGTFAFYSCTGLTVVNIPNSVESIEAWAFEKCTELSNLSLGNNVKAIGQSAFNGCVSLLELSIPNSVSDIGPSAFANCTGLTSISIPNNITSIGDYSFYRCSNLSTLIISSSVQNIWTRTFAECPMLENVYCYAKTPPETTYNAFENSHIEYATLYVRESSIDEYKNTVPWSGFKDIVRTDAPKYNLIYIIGEEEYRRYIIEEGSVITPEPAPTKEGYTFSGWSEIPTTMPANDVTVTGSFSINKYKLIYKVDGEEYKSYDVEYGAAITPEAAPTKEGYTFSGWSEIPTTMPAKDVTVTGTFSINKYKLFYKVDGEEYKSYDVEYGATITPEAEPTKEGYTFSGWSDIPETMPANDVTITGSFSINKYKLIYMVDGEEYKSYDVEYGATITAEAKPTKEGYEFSGWSDIPETMPAKDVTITGTFKAIDYVVDGATYEVSSDGATIVGGGNYSGDVEISSTIVVNDKTYTLTSISDGAFQNNTNITSVSIPESVTTIGANAFNGCSNLGNVNVGKSVSNIGSKAFANLGSGAASRRATTRGASGLVIKCYATNVPTTAADAFENTSISNATLLVDDNSVEAYKTSAPWSGFGTIMGFNEAAGMDGVLLDNGGSTRIFSIDGVPINEPRKGINIIKLNNGKTKKVVVK